jgi:hypothetical protein
LVAAGSGREMDLFNRFFIRMTYHELPMITLIFIDCFASFLRRQEFLLSLPEDLECVEQVCMLRFPFRQT